MMNKNIEKVLDVALKRRSHYALGVGVSSGGG